MAPSRKLRLHDNFIKRLKDLSNLTYDCDCGYIVGNEDIVLDIVRSEKTNNSTFWPTLTPEHASRLRSSFPFGVEFIGFWFKSKDQNVHQIVKELVESSDSCLPSSNLGESISKPRSYIVIAWQAEEEVLSAFQVEQENSLHEAEICQDGVDTETYYKSLIHFRIRASEIIEFEDEADLAREINRLKFTFNESVFLIDDSNKIVRKSSENGTSNLVSNNHLHPLSVNLFHGNNNKETIDDRPCPLFSYSQHDGKYKSIRLHFDALLVLNRSTSLKEMWNKFCSAMHVSLCTWQLAYNHSNPQSFKMYHFKPLNCNTTITTWLPNDDTMVDYRKAFHHSHLLRDDRPCFRKTMALFTSFGEDECLINPHSAIVSHPPKNNNNKQTAVIDGYCAYRHYMQDGVNDDGWGCAYRSLQTIVSWFKRQGYASHPIPTHTDIQKSLVAIGDKPSKIIGSKLWIGSFEVSLCLEKMLDVQCRIVHCSSGAEIASKARELLRHFNEQGTPIMIGGGVLAHTIIGVELDEMSGDVTYLILDPHYTGQEDLKLILKKGWCGWKSNSFWDKTAHYNLCLPQRPDQGV